MPDPDRKAPSRRDQVRSVVALAAGVFIVLFAVMNTQQVTIHWVFTTTHSPLIVAVVGWALLGVVVGLAIPRMRRRRAERRRS